MHRPLRQFSRRFVSSLLLAGGALALSSLAQAQPAPAQPSAAEMVEMLKTQPAPAAAAAAPAVHTRSLRNLSVESTAAPSAPPPPAARPQVALDIQFDFDSARVRPESQPVLDHLAQALQSPELAQARFAVEGHTDAKGGDAYNLRLSQSRADAVRDYLALHGVAAQRLTPIGKGATDPANTADAFSAENRRVRVVNLE
jgi:OOP family OmpA-OmpF porin